ncbi:M-phase inducer phosphatase 1-B-like [Physella acuta]|uniref:M-phase inducer phosphatase 1-B-like n=1 Tax=Physella acuta TaxID=109671 RepID=UPI0027DD9812|nr:M-phase inducer phosphatase 1-B-like [Physella acuta]XP_059159145.1 M-phase inducer phosphatase 1-B-like [Physella acuta]
MSKRSKSFNLPLKNITALHSNTMSYTGESGFSNLTNSPMSSLAFNLSELSTGRTTPRLRRKLSLSSVDTPPGDSDKLRSDCTVSAESGCFSESPIDDSPTLHSLSIKRYHSEVHPDIPLEAFSLKKKTISFRRFNSQPLPTLRLDSPTDFLEQDKEDEENLHHDIDGHHETDENSHYSNRLYSDETMSQDSGLGLESDRRCSMSSFDDAVSCVSSPNQKLRGSSSTFDDVSSISSSNSSLNQLDHLPSLEDIWNDSPSFKAPKGKPPKRSRSLMEDKHYNEDTCSPIKYSPVKSSSLPRPSFSKALFAHIPEVTNESLEENKGKSDDGFQELFEIEELKNEAHDQVSTLISATLLHRPNDDVELVENKRIKFTFGGCQIETPSSRPVVIRRGLHRSQSLDIRPRPSFKRSEPPEDDTTPVQNKRWRGEQDMTVVCTNSAISEVELSKVEVPLSRRLHRCHSETEAMIKSAVTRMFLEPDLIGDCSKPYCLPTIKGKHQDLKSITPETLSRLIYNEFSDVVEEYHIIDCRYPYEFEGGHIHNAENVYTKEDVIEKYLRRPLAVKDAKKRIILVFHCEFSSERGPGLFRFLRSQDRETNKEFYPFLHYPEIYLLEGGYKNFFENYSHLCEPREYKTMFDKNHSEDLRKFRAKCKSWSEDKSQQRTGVRNLKF